eukprot:scaffold7972_cov565-Prasinococcus_capsulatus_cf.AAC.1
MYRHTYIHTYIRWHRAWPRLCGSGSSARPLTPSVVRAGPRSSLPSGSTLETGGGGGRNLPTFQGTTSPFLRRGLHSRF